MRVLVAITLALAACNDSSIVVGGLQDITTLKANPNPNLDILFVIDDSISMAEQQASLAQNFPLMMDVLAQLDGGLPNLHIGVVTSDMGTSGSASSTPAPGIGSIASGGCADHGDAGALQAFSPALTGMFISDVDDGAGGRLRNYTGALRDVFAENARGVGATGCGFEQHLAAMRAALANPANTGFLRPDANLAVVIIADEDDCSVLDSSFFSSDPSLGPIDSFRCTRFGITCDPGDMSDPGSKSDCEPDVSSTLVEDVQPFINALLEAKGDPRMIMVAGIVGDPTPVIVELGDAGAPAPSPRLVPSCIFAGPNGEEQAHPAVRLSAFLDAFPGRSQLTSICSSDLSTPLAIIGDSAKKLVGDPCLDSAQLADTSPEPGLQPACEVVDVRDSAPDQPTVLPTCTTGATDCYDIIADAAACPAAIDHLRVRFRRAAPASDDTWTHVRCQLTP